MQQIRCDNSYIFINSVVLSRHAVPQESQPWWWPPGCQSCIHPPQSAAHLLKDCWHETGMACWLPGSPLCGSHSRTGRTRHHHWAHNILGKNGIQSVNSVCSPTKHNIFLHKPKVTSYLKLHTYTKVIIYCSYEFDVSKFREYVQFAQL